jgi:anion-transporting  ArsA/GET3 family ATPase
MMLLRVKVIYRAVFENSIVQTFLDAIPGFEDLLMIGKAYFHATEQHSDGTPVWDKVVVDAPATGHGIFLLQIPSVIESSLHSGHMYEEAREILEFLQDPDQSALNLVTLAEEMPVNETLMLRDRVREKVGMPIGAVIVNGLYEEVFGESERNWIEVAAEAYEGADEGLRGMMEAAQFRRQRVDMQREYLRKLRDEMDGPFLEIPYFFEERITFPEIEAISERFREASQ